MQKPFTRAKLHAGATLFRATGVDRLHIIGCARSGTTFLQYCMLAYENTRVENAETSPHYPGFQGKLSLAFEAFRDGGFHYITKRTYGWFEEERIEELIDAVKLYNAGILLMIRDPRAVLVSKHRRAEHDEQPYVDEERWFRSMQAGERVWQRLGGYPRKCVIRYEDLIRSPNSVDERIQSALGLKRREGIEAINAARTNADKLGYRVSREQREAMHGLRDADPSHLNKDPDEVEIRSQQVREKYQEYVARYDDLASLLPGA